MPTVPTPGGPTATARPIGEFLPDPRSRVVVLVGQRGHSRRFARTVAACTGIDLDDVAPDSDHDAGEHLVLHRSSGASGFAEAGVRAGRLAQPGASVDCLLGSASADETRRFATAAVTAGQQTRNVEQPGELRLWCSTGAQMQAATSGLQIGARVLLARKLGNMPSNTKSPAWLAAQARSVVGRDVRVRVRDVAWLARHGFGGLLAVGGGSSRPPNLTQLEYRGSDRGPHVVLVGKGISFDSGGLSLKPAESMTLMKTDMSGAAAVIGAVAAVADRRLPVRVTGLLACAENMPSGSAMRPGDVVRHHGGRTTEIINTDAEGRLVIADCLAFAARQLQPDYLVDIATLTGAATVGLGRQHAALLTPDDRLAQLIGLAAERSGEAVWRLPLASQYRPAIASYVADAANANTDDTVKAGTITAALFLQPFAAGSRWAHLDIAGTGRTESDRPDNRKGATGFGVRLLARFLEDRSAAR